MQLPQGLNGHGALGMGSWNGFIYIECRDCLKNHHLHEFRVERLSGEGLQALEQWMFGYYMNEPCERDEESLLPK